MALCDSCDAKAEADVKGQFLNELCDCDRYTRWICDPCRREETSLYRDYFSKHTLMEWDWPCGEYDDDDEDYEYAPSKYTHDHQHDRAVSHRKGTRLVLTRQFWCICSAKVKQDIIF